MRDFDERVLRTVPSEPEPVYEYRVVCADGVWRWGAALNPKNDPVQAERSLDQASSKGGCSCGGSVDDRPHPHSIERRAFGPWEAT